MLSHDFAQANLLHTETDIKRASLFSMGRIKFAVEDMFQSPAQVRCLSNVALSSILLHLPFSARTKIIPSIYTFTNSLSCTVAIFFIVCLPALTVKKSLLLIIY